MAGLVDTSGAPVEGIDPISVQDWAQVQAQQARAADAEAEPEARQEMPAPPKRDQTAPYGRKADGTPKKGPGGRPPRGDRARAQAPSPAETGGPPKDYTPGLRRLFGTAFSVAVVSSPADAGAIALATPALVDGWNGVAQRNAKVGRVLDLLTDGADLGGAAVATVMLGLQIAANHNMVKADAVAAFGVRPREELEAVAMQAVHEIQEQQAA